MRWLNLYWQIAASLLCRIKFPGFISHPENILYLMRHVLVSIYRQLGGGIFVMPPAVFYMGAFVKIFTFEAQAATPLFRLPMDTFFDSRRPLPNRNIRRVHVMPHSTNIRRIGCTRSHFCGGDEDDPAGRRSSRPREIG